MGTLHYTSGGSAKAVGAAGFNLVDVSSVEELNALPEGTKGLVWLDEGQGVTPSFLAKVKPFIDNSKVFGFFLMDEPDPTGKWGTYARPQDLKAQSDWLHTNIPGAKTFITMMNLGSTENPDYSNNYNWNNTHIDYFGLSAYLFRTSTTPDYSWIDRHVEAALAGGIAMDQIVPIYQGFGGGNWDTDTGGSYRTPTAAELQKMLDRWEAAVPDPVFDYAYKWGTQNGDVGLESLPALQTVFKTHNLATDPVSGEGETPSPTDPSPAEPSTDPIKQPADSTKSVTLFGDSKADTLTGGSGGDVLYGRSGNDTMAGAAGKDRLHGEAGNDRLDGGDGDDLLYGGNGSDTLIGRFGTDKLYGGDGNDVLDGGDDNDRLAGGAGADTLDGGAGADFLYGGMDNDKLVGGAATDKLYGGEHDDLLYGGDGNDWLAGSSGADRLDGGAGGDFMSGGTGNDTYRVDSTADVVSEVGGSGTDTVYSTISVNLADAARFKGIIENVTLEGSARADITGNAVANVLKGNAAANTIDGGAGKDTLYGHGGKDIFRFSTPLGPDNLDRIADYNVADDTIHLARSAFGALKPGALPSEAFHIGAKAHDANDRIVYNSTTGALLFDKDGTGNAAAIQFATLGSGLDITDAEFWVI